MKIDAKQQAATQPLPPKHAFKQVLKTVTPQLKKKPAVPLTASAKDSSVKTVKPEPLTPRVQAPVTHVLSQTRASTHHTEAQRLHDVRGHHVHTAQQHEVTRAERGEALSEKQEGRVLELLGRELVREAPLPQSGVQSAPSTTDAGAVRAAEAMKLVERVETFMKSGRPGLSLTLNNSLGARAEITRVGVKEVSLTLVGRTGPIDAQVLNRVREELAQRGLKVRQLLVSG